MNKKLVIQFTALTMAITVVCWGGMVALSQLEIMLDDHWWLYIPFMLGGLSPTIASYIVLKRNNQVTGFKEWLKNVFNAKSHIGQYLFVVLIFGVYFTIYILVSGLDEIAPFYMFFVMLPVMVVGGGLEEAG